MKHSAVCPKCGGREILRVEGTVGPYGSGNHIPMRILNSSAVKVHRYLCCGCGYSEEWIDAPDILRLKKNADRLYPSETISYVEKKE